METSNIITVSFVKSDFKDLLILEMVNHMKENWKDNKVLSCFLIRHLASWCNVMPPIQSNIITLKNS